MWKIPREHKQAEPSPLSLDSLLEIRHSYPELVTRELITYSFAAWIKKTCSPYSDNQFQEKQFIQLEKWFELLPPGLYPTEIPLDEELAVLRKAIDRNFKYGRLGEESYLKAVWQAFMLQIKFGGYYNHVVAEPSWDYAEYAYLMDLFMLASKPEDHSQAEMLLPRNVVEIQPVDPSEITARLLIAFWWWNRGIDYDFAVANQDRHPSPITKLFIQEIWKLMQPARYMPGYDSLEEWLDSLVADPKNAAKCALVLSMIAHELQGSHFGSDPFEMLKVEYGLELANVHNNQFQIDRFLSGVKYIEMIKLIDPDWIRHSEDEEEFSWQAKVDDLNMIKTFISEESADGLLHLAQRGVFSKLDLSIRQLASISFGDQVKFIDAVRRLSTLFNYCRNAEERALLLKYAQSIDWYNLEEIDRKVILIWIPVYTKGYKISEIL